MTRLAQTTVFVILASGCATACLAQDTAPALPFAGTDLVVLHGVDGLVERMGGTIQDITGKRLTMRRNGRGDIRVLRISDVAELTFQRSVSWEDGLQLYSERKFSEALVRLDHALQQERRDWAWRELQAAIAKTLIRMGRRGKAVARIEEIVEKDPRTRHVSMLPLVWDESLPENERLMAEPSGLQADTVVRRLVAASSLLHVPEYRGAASAVLERIRREEGLSPAGELARSQLWRLHRLETPNEINPVLQVWDDRVREMPVVARYGPRYVVAQGYLGNHDYDRASLAFLWMPLMSSSDEALAAKSLVEAIRCLKLAGRPAEASHMTRELQSRFPHTSAAQEFQAENKALTPPSG